MRVTQHSSTLIDHILVSDKDYAQEYKCITTVAMSDHYPVGICWKTKRQKNTNIHEVISYHRTKDLNYDLMSTNIHKKLLDIQQNNISNVDVLVTKFVTILTSEIESHAPLVKKRVKHNKQPVWFNTNILMHINKRNSYKISGDMKNYRVYRNLTKGLTQKTKETYYKHILKMSKGNTRKVWQYIN